MTSTKKGKRPNGEPVQIYTCDSCAGLRCVHKVYGKLKDPNEFQTHYPTEKNECLYLALVKQYQKEEG
jgi:hypothetical protein